MQFFGLHILDYLVLLGYLVAMVIIGKKVAKTIKNQDDFYLAGRKLGKALQFFLHFGSMTDASAAPGVASEVYRRGLSGSWLALQSLFITPFFWFSKVWWRRARVITLSDFLNERFGGKSCGFLYAVYAILLSIMCIGFGNLAAYKIMSALVVKPEAVWSAEERRQVEAFYEYGRLQQQYDSGTLDPAGKKRLEDLEEQKHQGQLHAFISYLQEPLIFYLIYSLVIGLYMVWGGFLAAVITDTIQGVLIVVFSCIIIPFGLAKLGGLSGLGENVPAHMLQLFGTEITSDYTWYSILAILAATLVGYYGSAHELLTGSAARDEFSARLGAVTGSFGKRLMTVAWILCGIIGLGLFQGGISDPDMTWGVLSRSLLCPGLLGLMLAGILAGNMSTIDAGIITSSSLWVRNIYTPFSPTRPEKHYVFVGRIAAIVILVLGIAIAMTATGLIPLLKVLLTLPTAFGAVALLSVLWRRLTKTAVLVEVTVMLILVGVLPYVLGVMPAFRKIPALTAQTPERTVTVRKMTEDGEEMWRARTIKPQSLYFESVVRENPEDPASPLVGVGRFSPEIYITGLLGIPVERFSKAGLVATRFAFCAIAPLILVMLLSWVTKPPDKPMLDRFFVKLKTPVAKTPEEDDREIQLSFKNPRRFDHKKLFPKSAWEFNKWSRQDAVGFFFCWVAVGLILCLLWLILSGVRL